MNCSGLSLAVLFLSLTVSLSGQTVPQGVRVNVFASSLSQPTQITFDSRGRLWVAQRSNGIAIIEDSNRDGVGDTKRNFGPVFSELLGLFVKGDTVYAASRTRVSILIDADRDGSPEVVRDLIPSLPSGRHQTDGLAIGPDNKLYIGQGSVDDRGETGNSPPLQASILQANLDGSGLRVFAAGLRNPYDLAFHPVTGKLFATDNGRDNPSTGVPEELNYIVEGRDYGWPDCWGNALGTNCAGKLSPIAVFQEHSSADGICFYTGNQFPPEYKYNLFVALYGDNAGTPTIGRKVMRVELQDTAVVRVSEFASGFVHPLDVTTGPDGALYVADFGTGIIYRIIYAGITDVESADRLPSRYRLEQNYPNPFNPSTVIEYDLPAASSVSLKVFDILGRELVTLVNGYQLAGFKSEHFDGSHLAAGVYFYRVLVADPAMRSKEVFQETKKMVLVK